MSSELYSTPYYRAAAQLFYFVLEIFACHHLPFLFSRYAPLLLYLTSISVRLLLCAVQCCDLRRLLLSPKSNIGGGNFLPHQIRHIQTNEFLLGRNRILNHAPAFSRYFNARLASILSLPKKKYLHAIRSVQPFFTVSPLEMQQREGTRRDTLYIWQSRLYIENARACTGDKLSSRAGRSIKGRTAEECCAFPRSRGSSKSKWLAIVCYFPCVHYSPVDWI